MKTKNGGIQKVEKWRKKIENGGKEGLKIVKDKMTNVVFDSNFHFYRIFLTFLI